MTLEEMMQRMADAMRHMRDVLHAHHGSQTDGAEHLAAVDEHIQALSEAGALPPGRSKKP